MQVVVMTPTQTDVIKGVRLPWFLRYHEAEIKSTPFIPYMLHKATGHKLWPGNSTIQFDINIRDW